MPFMRNGKRDYKRELQLAWEHKKKPNRVKDRAQRNAARSSVAKKAGKNPTELSGDVGHKRAISKGGANGLSNLFVQSPSSNRSFSRNPDGSMKSEQSKRERKKRRGQPSRPSGNCLENRRSIWMCEFESHSLRHIK